MKTNQSQYETIEQYLAGSLPEKARRAFEARLDREPLLQKELELHRMMQEAAADPVKLALRRRLADLSKAHTLPPTRYARFLFWSAAILCIAAGIAAWVVLHRPDSVQKPAPSISVQPNPPLPADSPPSAPPKAEPAPEKPLRRSGPIAAIDPKDFEPNSALDPLVDVQFRSEADFAVQLEAPTDGLAVTLRKGKATLQIKGLLSSAGGAPMLAFSVQLFSNRPEDFFEDRPVFSRELPLVSAGDAWTFDLSPAMSLKPGLYYLIIATEEREPVVVRRVRVKG